MKVIDQINESGIFAQSSYSANIATKDSNGNDITATYLTGVDLTPYQTVEGMTAYQSAGEYISANGFTQRITNPSNNKFISFWNEAGGSTATAQPAIYLSGQFGSAYYKDNELKIGRNNHTIAFNIGGSGPKISAAATGTVDSYMYVYNAGNSATISESGFNLKNSTADENVTIASIQSWNAKGDMHASSFSYDGDNKISAYNGSAFSVEQVITSTGGNANYVNQLNNKGISATVSYKARLDEGNHSISALYDTVSTNSGSWQTVTTSAGIAGDGTIQNPLRTDETVLWEGTSPQVTANETWTATLSEPASNFERVGLVLYHSYGWGVDGLNNNAYDFRVVENYEGKFIWTVLDDLRPSTINFGGNNPQYDANAAGISGGTTFICKGYGRYSLTTSGTLGSVTQNRGVSIRKVIGINRIGGNG